MIFALFLLLSYRDFTKIDCFSDRLFMFLIKGQETYASFFKNALSKNTFELMLLLRNRKCKFVDCKRGALLGIQGVLPINLFFQDMEGAVNSEDILDKISIFLLKLPNYYCCSVEVQYILRLCNFNLILKLKFLHEFLLRYFVEILSSISFQRFKT